MSNENYSPKAKIKDVYIELKDYKFFHIPFDTDQDETTKKMKARFVGRGKVKDRIKNLLRNTISDSGTYLITGFRGMGKTSVLRQSIAEINKHFEDKKKGDDQVLYRKQTLFGLFKRLIWFVIVVSTFLLVVYPKFICSLGLGGLTLSDFVVLGTIFLIAFIIAFCIAFSYDFKTIESDSKKYTSFWQKPNVMPIWTVFKLVSFLGFLFLTTLYIVFPLQFCDPAEFNFNCFKSQFAEIPIQLDADFSKILLALLGLILSYTIITIALFCYDWIHRMVFKFVIYGKKEKEKDHEPEKHEPEKYICFEINLSQETINDREVLKRINDKVLEYWKLKESVLNRYQFQRKIYKPWLFLIQLISTRTRHRISPYHAILNKLEILQKRLMGAVSTTQELGTDPNLAATFGKAMTEITIPVGKVSDRSTINYSLATAKEAEDELICIFNEIRDFNVFSGLGEKFVFIIDELDKIEPQTSSILDDREFSNPALDANINMPGTREYRKRQEAVANLLANLKGFLNAIKAKFFFIGGRELFDADLADIADRDSFYGSIFNDVIYVESFYKDIPNGIKRGRISSLTEEYLIKLILGESEGENNLKNLYACLKKDKENESVYSIVKDVKKDEKGVLNDVAEFKIISLLQNYIIYLTYRSTGSPKKLTTLTEHLIVSKDELESNKRDALIVYQKTPDEAGARPRNRLFLKFGYNIQYEINLTTDILRPYLINNSRFLTELGDKLLFSTPFIFDYVIKFYPYGFSWRNLELIPEVVIVNKEPYLRDHIKSILDSLSRYLIKPAVSGLYKYKFHSIVRKELSILTKRSDLAAAAFNFTLDESLLVKRHYKKKLIELRDKYRAYQPLDGDNQFVHSICFVQNILGDLYFYDKEYDEAILYYTESIQALRLPNNAEKRFLTRHQYLIWLRTTLKIGLTLEKIEAYDSAKSLYRTIMLDSLKYLSKIININPKPYLEEVKTQISFGGLKSTKKEFENWGEDPRSEVYRNMHLITLPFVAHLCALEKQQTDGITYSDLYQNKEELKNVIEPDYNANYLNDPDQKLHLLNDRYRKGWLWADYFSNVGSILFYKNCQFTRFFSPNVWIKDSGFDSTPDKSRKFNHSEYNDEAYYHKRYPKKDPEKDFDNTFYLKTDFPEFFQKLHLQYNKATNFSKTEGASPPVDDYRRSPDYFPSLAALCYYWEALNELTVYHKNRINIGLKNLRYHKEEELSRNFNPLQYAAFYLLPEFTDMVSGKRFYYLANTVSKIGDAVLGSLDGQYKNTPFTLKDIEVNLTDFRNAIRERKQKPKVLYQFIIEYLSLEDLFSFKKILAIYTLSSELYRRSGQNYYYTFGQKKILILLKETIYSNRKSFKADEPDRKEVIFIVKELCIDIIRSTSWYNSISNRAQIKKYRDTFNLSGNREAWINSLLHNAASNQNDVLEAIIMTESIKMQLTPIHTESETYFKLGHNDMVRNKYVRLLHLKYHIEQQYIKVVQKFKDLKLSRKGNTVFDELLEKIEEKEKYGEEFDFLKNCFLEAIFALRESIKIIEMYTPGYIIGYSYLATAHYWAGQWCKIYENYFKYKEKDKRDEVFYEELKKLLGQGSLYFLESNYQYEMAIQSYYNVLQMHAEGAAYKKHACGLFFLEDDYNDNLTHFNISVERYQVNTGQIRERINKLNEIVRHSTDADKRSKLYKYENYVTMYSGEES